MVFQADAEIIDNFLEYFQYGDWFIKVAAYLFCGVIVVVAYYYDGIPALLFMSAGTSIFAYRAVIRPFFMKVSLLNHTVKVIDFRGDEISITTVEVDIYYGLIKRAPMSFTVPAENVSLRMTDEKYGIPEYTGRIWLLFGKGQELLLAEKFFEDFGSLMSMLNTPYEVDG